VRDIELTPEPVTGRKFTCQFDCVNIGDTEGTNILIGAVTLLIDPSKPIPRHRNLPWGAPHGRELTAGERLIHSIHSPLPLTEWEYLAYAGGGLGIAIVEKVRYEDALGVARVTAFARIYDSSTGYFQKAKNPVQEYVD
jgi:hypothetical protein